MNCQGSSSPKKRSRLGVWRCITGQPLHSGQGTVPAYTLTSLSRGLGPDAMLP